MISFFTDWAQYAFLQYALLAGALAAVTCGIVGTFVVTKRITYVAGGIAHSVLGGLGFALYMQKVYHWDFFHPYLGALAAGLVAALTIGLVTLKARQREDTVIGAIWAIGMAVGILFIAKTPGYNQDLMSYLFGDILMVSPGELWLIAFLDLVVVMLTFVFYNHFKAVCFDEEFARVRNINVEFYYLLLLCMVAVTVVLLVSVVGIIMVIALLTLPVAAAANFSKSLWRMMLLSILLSVALTTSGIIVSYKPDLPTGATIIVLSGLLYLATLLWAAVSRKRAS